MFNYLTVDFPETDIPPQRVYKFSFKQERYAHETAKITFRDWDVPYGSIKPGYPVRILLRSTEGNREFLGYILSITPKVTPGKRFVEVEVIGASYRMKQARQRVFTDTTADAVVKTIATENNFSYFVEPHGRVYPQIAQAGHTDLELLRRLAMQCGYTLRLQNTSLYFRPLGTEFVESQLTAPRFVAREATHPEGSTIYSFSGVIGENLKHQDGFKAAFSISSVDLNTGNSFTSTQMLPPVTTRVINQPDHFDAYATRVVVPDANAADYELAAIDARNQYPYRALVSVIGTPSLHPDMPIYLDGIGTNYSGYWTVLAAEHKVSEESTNVFKYVTILMVGTDSLGAATNAAAPVTSSMRILTAGVRNAPIIPTSTLINLDSSPNLFTSSTIKVSKVNRALSNQHTTPYWVSNVNDLTASSAIDRLPSQAYDKLVSKNVI